MKKNYRKAVILFLGLIAATLGAYGVNYALHAEVLTNFYSIEFVDPIDQINSLTIKTDGRDNTVMKETGFNDGPLSIHFTTYHLDCISTSSHPHDLGLFSKDYVFHPNFVTLFPEQADIPIQVRADYDPNHCIDHTARIRTETYIEKPSFTTDETAVVAFDSEYPYHVVYYRIKDEGTWQQAPDGTINVNAESNQPQDVEIEYRFAGYYENEIPPTLDELQDPKYLNNVIVHFEATAAGGNPVDPNPIDPGDDSNDPTVPDPDDPGNDNNDPTDPNPVDPGDDNNDPTVPDPDDPKDDDNDPTDPDPDDPVDNENDPTVPNDDNDPTDTNDPDNEEPESDDSNNDDNDDNESDDPDNTDDEGYLDNNNPDYPNNDNSNNGQLQDYTTGANTGDFTNALLWVTVSGIGCFCIVYPIRKRMGEK